MCYQTKIKAETNPLKFLVERSQTLYNIDMEKQHIPVLLSEVLAGLNPKPGESYLDLTAGFGGHASEILDVTQSYKTAVLVDRDEFAAKYLRQEFPPETKIIQADFYSAMLQLFECGQTFDLILADFGVSSPQLDREERGFSFKADAPLDMRMDRTQKLTAALRRRRVVFRQRRSVANSLGFRRRDVSPPFQPYLTLLIVINRRRRQVKASAQPTIKQGDRHVARLYYST